MKQISQISIFLLLWSNINYAQSNVALLQAPPRPLLDEVVIADKLVSMPFDLRRGMIYVRAEIEGRIGDFILDTGAPGLVINELPVAASEEYVGQSCSRAITIGDKTVKTFSWARRTLRNVTAVTVDLSHLDDLHEAPVAGMIGYELLKNRTLYLDYERERLLLAGEPADLVVGNPVARLPFTFEQHLPIVEIEVGGRTLRLGIDTGAATNLLDRQQAAALAELITPEPTEEVQGLDQEVHRAVAGRLEDMSCGDLQFSTSFLLLDLAHLTASDESPLHGLLGYQFLKNYRVAIDYTKQEILLWSLKGEVACAD